MEQIEVTRLSSKGQIVLPQAVRERLRLEEGVRFVVIASGDTVILKRLEIPSLASAQALVYKSRAFSKKSKLSLSKVKEAIRKARSPR